MLETRPLLHHDEVAAGYSVLVQEEDSTVWRALIDGVSYDSSVIRFCVMEWPDRNIPSRKTRMDRRIPLKESRRWT